MDRTCEADETACTDVVPAGDGRREVGQAVAALLLGETEALVYKYYELQEIAWLSVGC